MDEQTGTPKSTPLNHSTPENLDDVSSILKTVAPPYRNPDGPERTRVRRFRPKGAGLHALFDGHSGAEPAHPEMKKGRGKQGGGGRLS